MRHDISVKIIVYLFVIGITFSFFSELLFSRIAIDASSSCLATSDIVSCARWHVYSACTSASLAFCCILSGCIYFSSKGKFPMSVAWFISGLSSLVFALFHDIF